ncbi:MAG: transketolase family protein [Propionibacteriaceae bacterium]|jgi:transketolase|nr:transketolase family protein [Propionibacteriaceae bacterium]
MSVSTREAYGRELCELGKARRDVVVFDADLTICTMTMYFAAEFPERFFNAGIAEANMMGMAAGMASTGKTVFANSFAVFSTGRAYDQVRNSIAYPGLNVKVVGTHAGLSVGEDGATHQALEDVALMRAVPGMTVVVPADENETRAAVRAIAELHGPCYLRLGRAKVDDVTDSLPGYGFELGKAVLAREGADATIIAAGLMLQAALQAADQLHAEGISARVLDMHTIKPLDNAAVIAAATQTRAIVTAEEHNVIGGLGSAVAEVVAEAGLGVPVLRVGTKDVFGHSGPAADLLRAYGLTAEHVAAAVRAGLGRA